MKINVSEIPEDKDFSDYPEDTEFELAETFPRYLLNPFEIIGPSDPRYEKALTREQIEEMKN